MRLKINFELFCDFIRTRSILGIPSRIDILASVQRTKTRTYYPEGWEWK
jgi:hypothetical protein